MRIIDIKPNFVPHEKSLNFKCPYQANVINMLEIINRVIVDNAFILVENLKCKINKPIDCFTAFWSEKFNGLNITEALISQGFPSRDDPDTNRGDHLYVPFSLQ